MTSGSLYCKLLKEDMRRRLWAIALVFLAFFFTLPIGLALSMENAANSDYFRYNDYQEFVRDSAMTDAQFQTKLMELKTKVVMENVGYGNGLMVFLLITAAVVIGVSSFSYLHNKKKIDFYHSIPVRRESLFAAQYTGGIFIVGAAYLVNLLMLLGVAVSYGVPAGGILGSMAGSWLLNMLYYVLMYAVTVTAMMMTGNMVVGILGAGVFFFFIPSVMLLLSGYCEAFFITSARYVWTSEHSLFMWGIKYLSPISVYINSCGWKMSEIQKHVPELICTVLAFLAITTLNVQLYRKRPSEAAGKAMAFKKTMAPIRILLVLGSGLAGAIFFWMLQSRMRWGIFGGLAAVVLTHCIMEIIYHFDFKKLFCHRFQMGLCLAAVMLIFLSFRYDWYGYDSYIPKADQVVSASLELDADSGWLSNKTFTVMEDGSLRAEYRPTYEYIDENMTLTDMGIVMPMAQEGRDRVLAQRDEMLGIRSAAQQTVNSYTAQAEAVSYIGGSDGPTSIFIAAKTGGEGQEDQDQADKYFTGMTVTYRLANGREVRRYYYNIPLSSVMDSYKALFDQKEYKEGLYPVLKQEPSDIKAVLYKEAGQLMDMGQDSRVLGAVLRAYQEDLGELSVERMLEEMPIGTMAFITSEEAAYMKQERHMYEISYGGYREKSYYSDNTQYWPVYPSFARTINLLKEQGIDSGAYFAPENVEKITINIQNCFYENGGELPEGEALAELQRINPYYQKDGSLVLEDSESIGLLMKAIVQEECLQMNSLQREVLGSMFCRIDTKDGGETEGYPIYGRLTPEMEIFFKGIPLKGIE